MTQLAFAGECFRMPPPSERSRPFPTKGVVGEPLTPVKTKRRAVTVKPVKVAAKPAEVVSRKALQADAHAAVRAAETALLAEEHRPVSPEHWAKLAACLEQRAQAWLVLADAGELDPHGHATRAMTLAADADTARARMLRGRLAVTR